MGMIHTGLLAHYEKVFALKQYHKWSLTEIEDMLPWELDVFVTLLANYIDKLETDRKNRAFDQGYGA